MFSSNCSRLGGDDAVIELLVSFMFNDLIPLLPDLSLLHRLLSQFSLYNLLHGFFVVELTYKLHSDLLTAIQIIAKLIRLALYTLHLL